eukprot:SAG31_NODE_1834_length_7135_cov_6.903923_9_plen_149_part_00
MVSITNSTAVVPPTGGTAGEPCATKRCRLSSRSNAAARPVTCATDIVSTAPPRTTQAQCNVVNCSSSSQKTSVAAAEALRYGANNTPFALHTSALIVVCLLIGDLVAWPYVALCRNPPRKHGAPRRACRLSACWKGDAAQNPPQMALR